MIRPLLPLLASPTLGVMPNGAAARASAAALSLEIYNADAGSFHVNAVLVSGDKDAVLIDTGFTRADAYRIAAMVLDSGKTLKVIYVSQADPDFYFGAAVLKTLFPHAALLASAPTVKKIQMTLTAKLQVWGPRLGANAPTDVPIPDVMTGNTIVLEGQTLEIRGLDDSLPHRSYVWIPSLQAIVGGVNVFAGLHVWTADTRTVPERADWNRKLGAMAAIAPTTVIPGHMLPGEKQDASQLAYTQSYLTRFDSELAKAPNSAALVEAMKSAYPSAGLMVALEIGAKVNKGEMKW
jgi:glyoxylase-like metal-dependent hydrolase (beta-lactamase superfamily II)